MVQSKLNGFLEAKNADIRKLSNHEFSANALQVAGLHLLPPLPQYAPSRYEFLNEPGRGQF
jgi:hypothetical protein